ncbi:MAG: SAM-dependent methyltransferase [Planctomycetaceae bacterium]|nr:hypothetical protein [Planctomycetaceae bacterium]
MAKNPYVSRGGEKLAAALDAFAIDVRALTCADFGANVGGFTDCLLQRGAAQVYAIDTGYGDLAWTLRKDPRVVVMERTNALHCPVAAAVDLVVIDMAWTPLAMSVPAAAKWLTPSGRIVALLKPHYEQAKLAGRKPVAALSLEESAAVADEVCRGLERQGYPVTSRVQSPLEGKGGNSEFLVLIEPAHPLR